MNLVHKLGSYLTIGQEFSIVYCRMHLKTVLYIALIFKPICSFDQECRLEILILHEKRYRDTKGQIEMLFY